ncbi:hypothetical protein AYI70_g4631 [Smittium culicis]|uniref:Uncharacterized protein n=1 Tax=Smittium culicis TaxID=133412 RepID=A0A1R1XY94_9FUNG|nr:hypothetical protein AYI70_g4631 [Smittium culicis]
MRRLANDRAETAALVQNSLKQQFAIVVASSWTARVARDLHLHAVALLQELLQLAQLDPEIVHPDVRLELQVLQLDAQRTALRRARARARVRTRTAAAAAACRDIPARLLRLLLPLEQVLLAENAAQRGLAAPVNQLQHVVAPIQAAQHQTLRYAAIHHLAILIDKPDLLVNYLLISHRHRTRISPKSPAAPYWLYHVLARLCITAASQKTRASAHA